MKSNKLKRDDESGSDADITDIKLSVRMRRD